MVPEAVDHPSHYGGKDNLYEHVKVAEAWGLFTNAMLYNCTKYICRAGKKPKQIETTTVGNPNRTFVDEVAASALEDLRKARWYLNREIQRLEKL